MPAKKCVYFILIIFLIRIESNSAKKKPASHYIDLCRRNDPKLDQCIMRTIIKAIPLLVESGIPDIGYPSLDPFFIETLKMQEGSGNFKLSFIMSNTTMKGLINMSLQKFSINLKNESDITAKMETKLPWLHFGGKYLIDGKILLVPVQGSGDFFMNFTQPYLKGVMKCHTVINPKNNKKYFYADSFKWDIAIKGGKSYFHHLFNGNKALGDTVNRFLNANALDLFAAVKHLPEQAFGQIFKDVVNIFFNSFTFDELFLPE